LIQIGLRLGRLAQIVEGGHRVADVALRVGRVDDVRLVLAPVVAVGRGAVAMEINGNETRPRFPLFVRDPSLEQVTWYSGLVPSDARVRQSLL
jgi:riboflavin biosynthesis pyrimidine reductase